MEKHAVYTTGDDIDTDQIIASQYLMLPDIESMKEFTFCTMDADFTRKFNPGNCIIAGRNFGCGSSREQAPAVLKAAGASAVIAESFARIFFRNAVNIGLPVIECSGIQELLQNGDEIEIDHENNQIIFDGRNFSFRPFSGTAARIISAGGLIEAVNSGVMEVIDETKNDGN